MTQRNRTPAIFVDVDDTLVRSFGSKRIAIGAMVERVQGLHAQGAELYCWSSGGREYAQQSARELGIATPTRRAQRIWTNCGPGSGGSGAVGRPEEGEPPKYAAIGR